MDPSSFPIGCRPSGDRSMTDRRRWPKLTGPSVHVPRSLGPRCLRASVISSMSRMSSPSGASGVRKIPAMPHMVQVTSGRVSPARSVGGGLGSAVGAVLDADVATPALTPQPGGDPVADHPDQCDLETGEEGH